MLMVSGLRLQLAADLRVREPAHSSRRATALYSVTHFDNSHFNPNNPDPEAKVRFGLKSEQEMLNLRTKYEEVDFADAL